MSFPWGGSSRHSGGSHLPPLTAGGVTPISCYTAPVGPLLLQVAVVWLQLRWDLAFCPYRRGPLPPELVVWFLWERALLVPCKKKQEKGRQWSILISSFHTLPPPPPPPPPPPSQVTLSYLPVLSKWAIVQSLHVKCRSAVFDWKNSSWLWWSRIYVFRVVHVLDITSWF